MCMPLFGAILLLLFWLVGQRLRIQYRVCGKLWMAATGAEDTMGTGRGTSRSHCGFQESDDDPVRRPDVL